jgi:hypothetical protein
MLPFISTNVFEETHNAPPYSSVRLRQSTTLHAVIEQLR